jgi:hypothetical protein
LVAPPVLVGVEVSVEVGVGVNVEVGVGVNVEVGVVVKVGVSVGVAVGVRDWQADRIKAKAIVILNNQIFFMFASLMETI